MIFSTGSICRYPPTTSSVLDVSNVSARDLCLHPEGNEINSEVVLLYNHFCVGFPISIKHFLRLGSLIYFFCSSTCSLYLITFQSSMPA